MKIPAVSYDRLRQGLFSKARALLAVSALAALAVPNRASAQSTQTLTILGGNGNAGDIAANVEYYNPSTGNWQPAYLTQFYNGSGFGQPISMHPWGNISGTNQWINYRVDGHSDPGASGSNTLWYLYRVRFTVPSDAVNPKMTFSLKADNMAQVAINGVSTGPTVVGQADQLNADAVFSQSVHPGENTITLNVGDQGGLNGFNFRIDLSMQSSQPLVVVASGTPTTTVSAPVISPVPADIAVNATSSAGAVVNWPTVTATSNVSMEIFRRTTVEGEPWKSYTKTFTSSRTGNFTLGFNVVSATGGDNSIFIDAVKVTDGATTLLADGFETPTLGSNTGVSNDTNLPVKLGSGSNVSNWYFTNYGGIINGDPQVWGPIPTPPEGSQFAVIRDVASKQSRMTSAGQISLVAGQVYTVTFDQASRNDGNFSGALTYTVTLDSVESVPVTATPHVSGDTFPIGTTTELLTAVNSAAGISTASFKVTVSQVPATVALGNLSQTYDGTPKAVTVSTVPAGLPTSVTYGGNGTVPTNAGSYAVVATVTDARYVGSATGTLVIGQAAPVLTWNTPAAIVYGTALGSAQLNATASVSGTFTYTPAAGTVLSVGNQALSATFKPTDTTNYVSGGSVGTTITVDPIIPVVTFLAPVLTVPADIAVNAAGAAGTPVNFNATATSGFSSQIYSRAITATNAGEPWAAYTIQFSPTITGNYKLRFRIVAAGATNQYSDNSIFLDNVHLLDSASNTELFANAFEGTAVPDVWTTTTYAGVINGSPQVWGSTGPEEGTQRGYVQANSGNLGSLTTVAAFPLVAGQVYTLNYYQATRSNYGPQSLTYAVTLESSETDTVTATPASGSTFAIGQTSVGLTATNSAGQISTGSFNVTVSQIPATVTLGNLSQTYDGTPKAATVTTVPAGLPVSVTYGGSATAPTNAGSYAVVATVTDARYVGSATGTLVIGQAAPVLTWNTPAAIVYGTALGSAQLNATASVSGTFTYTPAAGTLLNAGATPQALSATFTPDDSANYVSGGTVGTVITVTPAPLTVTALGLTKVYGANDPSLLFSNTSLVGRDGFSGSLARAVGENVGSYAILQGTLTAGPNYALNYVGASLTITPKPAAVTPAAATKVYGSADPVLTGTLSGFLAADNVTATYSRTAGENVGGSPYTISAALSPSAVLSNYAITGNTAAFTITPATLTVTADAKTKVYGSADPALTYGATGFQFTDSAASVLNGALARATGETVAGGPYAIKQGGLASNSNYAIAFTGSALAITPAPLAIVANAQSKVFGAADPALTYSVGGLQFTDTAGGVLTGALTRAAGETVNGSPYAIQQGTLAANSNYTLGYTGANLTITAATAAITVNGYTGVYDSKLHGATGTATGVGSVDLSSLLNLGASFTNVPGGTASWSFHDPAGNYKDAGGSVAIVLSKAAATIVVTPYSVTYDGNAHTATGSAVGVTGEALAPLNLAGTTHTNAGTYTDTWTFTDVTGNYANATSTVSDKINQATATIKVTPYTVTYDGKPHTATGAVTGVGGVALTGLNLSGTTHTNASTYPSDSWTFTDPLGNYASTSGTVSDTINKAPETLALGNLRQLWDATPKAVTVTTAPIAAVSVTVTYTGTYGTVYGPSTTPPTAAGAYLVSVVSSDSNYSGTTSGILVISGAGVVQQGLSIRGEGGFYGSIQVLTSKTTTISVSGNGYISNRLLVAGLPKLDVDDHASIGSVQTGTGLVTPTNYTVSVSGNGLVGTLVTRTDPVAMPVVAAPPKPSGTVDVHVTRSFSGTINFTTLRNLQIDGNAAPVTVPAGTYGTFSVAGQSTLVFGTVGATTPSVYNLQGLNLDGQSSLQVAGPVVIVVPNGWQMSGTIGSAAHPEWLTIKCAGTSSSCDDDGWDGFSGHFDNVSIYGTVVAPLTDIEIGGNSEIIGSVTANRLNITGNGFVGGALPPPVVNIDVPTTFTVPYGFATTTFAGFQASVDVAGSSTITSVSAKLNGAAVTVRTNGLNSSNVDVSGALNLAPGSYTLVITATTSDGLTGSATATFTVVQATHR